MQAMTRDEIRNAVLRVLVRIAPEADVSQLKAEVRFRDQLDIDSVDFLNFLIALHQDLDIAIPERDYSRLGTLDDCVNYLAAAKKGVP
jgi:acyl carrier protein